MVEGRLESEMKISVQIQDKLKDCPEFIIRWQKNLQAQKITAKTRRDYLNKAIRFLYFINKNEIKNVSPKDITGEIIDEYITMNQVTQESNGMWKETSGSYQQGIYAALKNLVGFLYKRGEIDKNYLEGFKRPKNNNDEKRLMNERIRLCKEDFSEILSKIDEEKNFIIRYRDKAIMSLLMNTGIREGALVNINVGDVDLKNATIVVIEKKNKMRYLTLNSSAVLALNNWMLVRRHYDFNNSPALFLTKEGNRITEKNAYDMVVKRTKEGIGVGLSPHKIRAGYGMILYDITKDAEFVRVAMDHENIVTTQRYFGMSNKVAKKASELLEEEVV